MTRHSIAVSYSQIDNRPNAQLLANRLGMTLIENHRDIDATTFDYLLMVTPDYLGLQKTINHKSTPFQIDFLSGKMLYRQKNAGLRKELIARAIGINPRDNPAILDATAGLGRDSFILASLGFTIVMLERSPILYALLDDAIERAKMNTDIAHVIARMSLIHTEAAEWLTGKLFDVIYLDPMFPERRKSASVKKEMAILQELLGNDNDADRLLDLALTCATHRVVVKRPRLAPNIGNRKPNFSLSGKSSRFDIYLATKR